MFWADLCALIEIWQNHLTKAPSVQAGTITVDLGKETQAQTKLFQLVLNHPEATVRGAARAPLTPEIIAAFKEVVDEAYKCLGK